MERRWKPTKLERAAQAIAHLRATKQLMRVPWGRFHNTYEEYLRWHTLALWVRAITETAGSAPSELLATLKQRCPDFIENKTLANEAGSLGFRLQNWIHCHVFSDARQQGWLDALMFYGVRDIRSRNIWAYWEFCEHEWHHTRPSCYPNADDWMRSARNYGQQQEPSISNLSDAVDRYVEWKVFTRWFELLTTAKSQISTQLNAELQQRCPGLIEENASASGRRHQGKPRTGLALMRWIEEKFFAGPMKDGWMIVLRQQARKHPRYDRILQYSKRRGKVCGAELDTNYSPFAQWCCDAEDYIEP